MKSYLFTLSLGLSLLISACSHHENEHAEDDSIYLVSSPYRTDTSITQEYVCQIHSFQHIELRSQEKGYLTGVYVDEGDFVKKGQLLFQIMPKLYEADVRKAEAEAHLARIEYLNTKSLADSNVVSSNELAMARARLERANAELDLARVHLSLTKVKAPFDGIIDRFRVRPGSLVDEGEWLSSLSDNSKMWVYFNMPEAEYLNYMSKVHNADSIMNVQLLMANNKMFAYDGVIETIEADFNHETGNIPFRATFPNPKGLLRHGETGNVLINEPLKDALIIPQKATYEVLDKKYVFVLDEEDRLQSRKIEISREMPHLFVIKSGLEEGDKILIEGLRKVRNHQKIKYEFQDPAAVINSLDLYAE